MERSSSRTQAAIYSRVSTTRQEDEGTSLDTQAERCRDYANAHGYAVSTEYREVFTGAVWRDRPKLTELRAAVRNKEFDVIICYDIDRLSRNQIHLALLMDEFEEAGVRV